MLILRLYATSYVHFLFTNLKNKMPSLVTHLDIKVAALKIKIEIKNMTLVFIGIGTGLDEFIIHL